MFWFNESPIADKIYIVWRDFHDLNKYFQWLPLYKDGRLVSGEFNLPVSVERPSPNYSLHNPEAAIPNMKWVDNHKGVFSVAIKAESSVFPQVCYCCFSTSRVFCFLVVKYWKLLHFCSVELLHWFETWLYEISSAYRYDR